MGTPLSHLLDQVLELPPAELEPRRKEKERPQEMALLDQVLSATEIAGLTTNTSIKRSCYLWGDGPEIRFFVRNGASHSIRIRRKDGSLFVTDNDLVIEDEDNQQITSVTELREYIRKLIKS